MHKNFLSSILFHFILGVAGYQLLFIDLKANELFILAFLLLLYIIGGFVFMKPQQSTKENFNSVSFLSILLLLTATLCSLIAPNPTQNMIWIIYAFANAPAIAILFNAHSDLLFLVYAYSFSVVPSLGLWIGLSLKNRKCTSTNSRRSN